MVQRVSLLQARSTKRLYLKAEIKKIGREERAREILLG
jgi:hypothetical protein